MALTITKDGLLSISNEIKNDPASIGYKTANGDPTLIAALMNAQYQKGIADTPVTDSDRLDYCWKLLSAIAQQTVLKQADVDAITAVKQTAVFSTRAIDFFGDAVSADNVKLAMATFP